MLRFVNGTCGECGEFTYVNEDQTECISEECEEGEILLEDGTCSMCSDYSHPDAEVRTCIADTCNNVTEFLTIEGICDVCGDYEYSDPETGFKSCTTDVCQEETEI